MVDLGNAAPDSVDYPDLTFSTILKAMDKMKYDVLNLGESDCRFGVKFLEDISDSISVAFVSTNIIPTKAQPHSIRPYVIKSFGNKKVAIIGLVPENAFEKFPGETGCSEFSIMNPKQALSSVLPKIKSASDFIILLSRLPFEETKALLSSFPEIDLVISSDNTSYGEKGKAAPGSLVKTEKVVGCSEEKNTRHLNKLETELTANGKITISRTDQVDLNDEVPTDEAVAAMIQNSYFSVLKEKNRQRMERKINEMHTEMKEGLNKTPEAFIREQQNAPLNPDQK
jgi:2',3'-cyclic-nucleotide 2'-phosphodiesterase (5'-nucleotidase family)